MSPEQSSPEIAGSSPPAFWCRPATFCWASWTALPVSILHVMLLESSVPTEESVTSALEGSFLYWSLMGACFSRNAAAAMLEWRLIFPKFKNRSEIRVNLCYLF